MTGAILQGHPLKSPIDRTVEIAGIVRQPDGDWMKQMARNLTVAGEGFLRSARYLIHDRDSLFTADFRGIVRAGGVETVKLPARSPNLKGYASHCTSCVGFGMTSGKRRRWLSFSPWLLTGGWLPGFSYRHSVLSLYA